MKIEFSRNNEQEKGFKELAAIIAHKRGNSPIF